MGPILQKTKQTKIIKYVQVNKGTAQEKVEKDTSAAALLPWGMGMEGEKFFLQLH